VRGKVWPEKADQDNAEEDEDGAEGHLPDFNHNMPESIRPFHGHFCYCQFYLSFPGDYLYLILGSRYI